MSSRLNMACLVRSAADRSVWSKKPADCATAGGCGTAAEPPASQNRSSPLVAWLLDFSGWKSCSCRPAARWLAK